jgi:hypothetical protein
MFTVVCNWGNLAAEERCNFTSLINVHASEINKRTPPYTKVHESYWISQKISGFTKGTGAIN